jgi:hypothetical protein
MPEFGLELRRKRRRPCDAETCWLQLRLAPHAGLHGGWPHGLQCSNRLRLQSRTTASASRLQFELWPGGLLLGISFTSRANLVLDRLTNHSGSSSEASAHSRSRSSCATKALHSRRPNRSTTLVCTWSHCLPPFARTRYPLLVMTAVRERAFVPARIFTHSSRTMGLRARYSEDRSISNSTATRMRGSPFLRSMQRNTASWVTFIGEVASAAS